MTDSVICKYVASGTNNQPTGQITLTECSPKISNDATLDSWDVIGINAAILVLALIVMWTLHRINKTALAKLKTDMRTVVKDVGDIGRAEVEEVVVTSPKGMRAKGH